MKSRLVFVLLAVILVPAGALALLGLRSFQGETERARSGLRERAEQALDAVRAALAEELARVERGEGDGIALRFDAEGHLEEPRLVRAGDPGTASGAEAPGGSGPGDPALFRFLEAEVYRLEAAGDLDRLSARLSEVGVHDGDPWLAAWSWSTLGAIEQRAGRAAEARRAWMELVQRHPGVRDERGLVRAFVARRFLAAGDPDPTGARLDLYADVISDHVSADDHATASFKHELALELALELEEAQDSGAQAFEDLKARDQELDRIRRLRRAWRSGIADWFARGAPGHAARFGEWVVVVDSLADDANPEGRAGALELERLVDSGLARPEIATFAALGFRTVVQGIDGLPQGEPAAIPLCERDLAAPFSGLTASVVADDMDGLLQTERRSFLLVTGLVALAVLFSLGAALATVRAIGREVEAARGREAFVAAVTHELKSPLASIRLLGEVLGQGGVEENKVREFGQRTASEAERLSGVITSVLELARLEHGEREPTLHDPVDLCELAREVVHTFEPQAEQAGFGLVLRAPERAIEVRADASVLGGALLNLLDNAQKYADRSHTIEVELGLRDGRARLEVLDRGRGVAPENAERIFEPFRRVGDELTRDRPGVGLGLALVRRIARAHGGEASYAPRAGGGSCFTIELPCEEKQA